MAKIKEENGAQTGNAAVLAFFKKNSDVILNLQESAEEYKISSGSLNLDYALNGGFGAGFNRLCGVSEAGKTTEAFLVMDNFLKKFPTGRGIYVKTERLGPEIRKRIAVKLVTHPDEWVDGTCMMLECNVYETVAEFISSLIMNDKSRKYCIIVDSMDGLILSNDAKKSYEEAQKVSGPAVLTKLLMKRISIYVEKGGHLIFLISQKTAEIQLDKYAPADPRMVTSSGGNAMVHFSNNILEFGHRYKGDDILLNSNEKPDQFANPIIGHWVKITLKKNTSENSHTSLKYPVKHGRIGNAVWTELEITEFLLNFGLIEKGGAWYNLSEDLITVLNKADFKDFDTKFQGEAKLHAFFQANPQIMECLKTYCLEVLSAK